MKTKTILSIAGASLATLWLAVAPATAQSNQVPQVKIPESGVPEIMTMEGSYVRAAYNNEGYVILGYQLANNSLGEEWMLLEVGMTVRDGVPNFTLTRDAISIETPDGKTIPLPSTEEYRKGDTRALQNRGKVIRDSINYFPPSASKGCRLGFFSDIEDRAMAWDQVELSSQRACVGRLYFPVAGGITYGQHWLNVKFQDSLVRVPFRILTKDEQKLLSKNYKSIEKQVKEAFKKKS